MGQNQLKVTGTTNKLGPRYSDERYSDRAPLTGIEPPENKRTASGHETSRRPSQWKVVSAPLTLTFTVRVRVRYGTPSKLTVRACYTTFMVSYRRENDAVKLCDAG